MKRIAEWFAAVGAAAGRKGKRLVAIVAAVAMLGGVAGVSATAMADDGNASTTQSQTTDEKAAASTPAPLSTEGTNGVPDDPTLSAPAREKTVTANEDVHGGVERHRCEERGYGRDRDEPATRHRAGVGCVRFDGRKDR